MSIDIPQISVEHLRTDLEQGVPLIDVREDDEYAQAHVPGAIHIPLATLPERLGAINADGAVDIICRSGARSQRAAEFLLSQGLLPRNVVGGTDAWVNAGYRVDTGPASA
jgi:rhodanese-related sulfurtransferase